MTRRQKATLVYVSGRTELMDWSRMTARDSRVIAVGNLNLLGDSLHLAQNFVDVEVVRVIFDHSVDAEAWLEFLTAMPQGFRGDVLYISRNDKAFLSAVGRSDERVMYHLAGKDIDFYLEVCGLMYQDEATLPFLGSLYEQAEAIAV